MTDETEALKPMLMTLGRDLAKIAGAALVTRGIITAAIADQIVGIAAVGAPLIYSQLKTWWNAREIAALKTQVIASGQTPVKK